MKRKKEIQMQNKKINMNGFKEYSRLKSIDELITDKSLMGYISGISSATEALSYLKSHIKSNDFELRVHRESINLAIKELDNIKISIQNAIRQKEKNEHTKLVANKKMAKKAKIHFDENVSPTFEVLISEMEKLSHIKGWGGTQTPTQLKSMLDGIKDNIEKNILQPSRLDIK